MPCSPSSSVASSSLGWMLRSVAVGIDRARATPSSPTRRRRADAAETERVAVAALMHDSVLAALIAAERARPREEALAVAMAREALTRLANAEQDAGEGPTNRCRGAGRRHPTIGRCLHRQENRTLEVARTSATTREIPGASRARSCSPRRRRRQRLPARRRGWSARDGAGGCRVGRVRIVDTGAASIRATSRMIASASAVRSWRAWRRSAAVRA
jgi:hypothetical protein